MVTHAMTAATTATKTQVASKAMQTARGTGSTTTVPWQVQAAMKTATTATAGRHAAQASQTAHGIP
jgi:hypothetical protein